MRPQDTDGLANVFKTAAVPVVAAGRALEDTAGLLQNSGELRPGTGLVTGVLALSLAFLHLCVD